MKTVTLEDSFFEEKEEVEVTLSYFCRKWKELQCEYIYTALLKRN